MKGSRVQAVVQELRGEKIDIVPYDPDPARFVCNAIAPAEVARVIIDAGSHTMELIVPDEKLSLAIGKKGQNVRLASQLTGWRIDIHSESKVRGWRARQSLGRRSKAAPTVVASSRDASGAVAGWVAFGGRGRSPQAGRLASITGIAASRRAGGHRGRRRRAELEREAGTPGRAAARVAKGGRLAEKAERPSGERPRDDVAAEIVMTVNRTCIGTPAAGCRCRTWCGFA
jgi:hypothetical protein